MKNLIINLVIIYTFFLNSCSHSNYEFPPITIPLDSLVPIRVNTIESLSQRSNIDYNLNNNGLITGETLQRWWLNWNLNKPPGIRGKLVLLHTASGDSDGVFIKPNEKENIYSYSIPNAMKVFGEERSNGILSTIDMVVTGTKFENILERYGINPSRDMIVFIPDGVGTNSAIWMALRGWYTFRYWGVDAKNLAVLNGGVAVNSIIPSFMKSNELSPEFLGTNYSVQKAKIDNTILQATLQDVMHYVDGRNTYLNGFIIIDARTPAEYLADRMGQWPNNTLKATPSANSTNEKPEVIPMEGHIRGSINLPFGNLLEVTIGSGPTAGRRFKSFSEIESIFQSTIPNYQNNSLIISYCRTNVRSMVTGFAAIAILGNPTQFYDGSWIEWGSLTGYQDTGITKNLDINSPWRTDRSEYTNNLSYNIPSSATPPSNLPSGSTFFQLPNTSPPITVEKKNLTNFQIYSRNSLQSIQEDKDYIRGKGRTSTNQPARPGNPCG